jgi:hypothetical protein
MIILRKSLVIYINFTALAVCRVIEMDGKQRSLILTTILVASFFLITAPHISAKTIAAGSIPVLHRKLIDPASCGNCKPGTGCCHGPYASGEKTTVAKDELPKSAYP